MLRTIGNPNNAKDAKKELGFVGAGLKPALCNSLFYAVSAVKLVDEAALIEFLN